jgi:hypothetical protein
MKTKTSAKKGRCRGTFFFLAFTAITAAVVVVTILEGSRIKKENELLSYEVW